MAEVTPNRSFVDPAATADLGECPTDGLDVLRSRFFNKGTAFTVEERRALGLEGVLPPHVESMDDQLVRVMQQYSLLPSLSTSTSSSDPSKRPTTRCTTR